MRDQGSPADISNIYDVDTGLLTAITNALGTYSETGDPVPNGYVRGGMGFFITQLMMQAARNWASKFRLAPPSSAFW